MEIVLQWLDDLDDVVFAGLLAWERLRRACLGLGLASASALAFCVLAAALEWVPLLAGIAAASVISALAGGAFAVLADPPRNSPRRA